MKLLLPLVCIFFHGVLEAQDCKVSWGTKTLYTPPKPIYTRPPAGYLPVCINHVGRHGARHLTKDVNTAFTYTLLMKADSLHALTGEGQKLKKMLLVLRAIEAPGLKSISERGKQELEGIAGRMAGQYGAVFKKAPLNLRVEITKEVRTAQSADAFLRRLKQTMPLPETVKIIDDTALRFFDLSPAYLNFEENGRWMAAVSAVGRALNTSALYKSFTAKFFNPSFVRPGEDEEAFSKDVYGFAAIVPSITLEAEHAGVRLSEIDFRSFFSCAQLRAFSQADEAEDFFLKGPGEDTMGIQVKIAAPLLVQFINTMDAFINGNHISLQLRFAHAETIAPFAALMQIATASRTADAPKNFSKAWKAEAIVPLSANIQWILYTNHAAKDYLVKFLLNEKEVRINGLYTSTYPYYNWNNVKGFYLSLLHRLNTGLTNNMTTYLTEVR